MRALLVAACVLASACTGAGLPSDGGTPLHPIYPPIRHSHVAPARARAYARGFARLFYRDVQVLDPAGALRAVNWQAGNLKLVTGCTITATTGVHATYKGVTVYVMCP